MSTKLILIVSWGLLVWLGGAATSLCKDYIQAVTTSALQMNISKIPIPTIMYSGITTNNPGQKYECEQKTPRNDPYHYFLIGFKNTTNKVNTFTGVCIPSKCTKEDIEQVLIHELNIKNIEVYDYPKHPPTNPLLTVCAVVVGSWLAVLFLWSAWVSFKEPVENQLIKKDEEVQRPNDREQEEAVRSFVEQKVYKKDDYKLFNFYQGYCRVFKRQTHKHILGAVLFLASFSIVFSTEFSYRQTIAANQVKSLKWFNSLGGVLFCNLQISFSVVMFVLGAKLAFSLYRLSSFHEIGRYFFDQLLIKWLSLVLATMTAYILLSFTDEPLNQLWKNNFGADCPAVMYQTWFLLRNLAMDCKVCLQWFWIMQVDILLTIVVAPLFIVYRTKKWLGYSLYLTAICISLVFSYGLLSNQNILFQPYKLFNMAKEFTINYQTNTLVRMSAYVVGVVVGLFSSQKKEKQDSGDTQNQHAAIKAVRRNQRIQLLLHLTGLSLMLSTLFLIIPYLPVAQFRQDRTDAYLYLVLSPLGYLLGLTLFLLPCLLQGESKVTILLNRVLGAGIWSSLQKLSVGFLWVGPVVIGFTTYSMQNSIYFDFETVFVYFLGDCVIIFVLTLLAVSSIDNQLTTISRWLQARLFGNQSKHSVVVIED